VDPETKAFLKVIVAQHHGLASQMARELRLNPCSITLWFQGHYRSPRLDKEIPRLLRERGLPAELPLPGTLEIDPLEAIL